MTDESSGFELGRRKALATIGGLAVAGTGLGALSATGAAASADISSSNLEASNDRGVVNAVTIDPSFSVSWSGLDDAVGKIFYLIEAKVGSGNYQPIFRATPWLEANQIGTSGSLGGDKTLSQQLQAGVEASSDSPENHPVSPLVIADEQGKPNYQGYDFSKVSGGVDYETFMSGFSMGSAGDYPSAHESPGWQNNYKVIDAGYYGAAAHADVFKNGDPGQDQAKATPVALRYTFELQRPNLSQLKYKVEDNSGWDSMSNEEKKADAAAQISGLEVSDIDAGNSRIVMDGEDGNYDFEGNGINPAGIRYSELRDHKSDHAGIIVAETSFNVTVTNETETAGSTGSSNSGIDAPETTETSTSNN